MNSIEKSVDSTGYYMDNVTLSLNSDCYRPQRSWAKVIFLQVCVCPQGGGFLQILGGFLQILGGLQFSGGEGCLQFFLWGGVFSNFLGGLQFFWGGVSPIFQVGGGLQFLGGFLQIFREGGLQIFFFFFFSISFPPKNSSGMHQHTPPPPHPRWSMRGRYASYWNAFFWSEIMCE